MTTAALIIVNAGLDVLLLCGLAYHMAHVRHLRAHTQYHETPEAFVLWQAATAQPGQPVAIGDNVPAESHVSTTQSL
jgi:hypothetical protein